MNEIYIDKEFTLKAVWDEQHPIIHTWLVFSSLSICVLSVCFYVL